MDEPVHAMGPRVPSRLCCSSCAGCVQGRMCCRYWTFLSCSSAPHLLPAVRYNVRQGAAGWAVRSVPCPTLFRVELRFVLWNQRQARSSQMLLLERPRLSVHVSSRTFTVPDSCSDCTRVETSSGWMDVDLSNFDQRPFLPGFRFLCMVCFRSLCPVAVILPGRELLMLWFSRNRRLTL